MDGWLGLRLLEAGGSVLGFSRVSSGWEGGLRVREFLFSMEVYIVVIGLIDTDTRLRRPPQQAIKRVLNKNQKQHGW